MTEFPRIHLGLVSQAISGSGFPLDMQGQEDLELPFHKVGSLAHTDESNYLSVAQNSITRETAAVLGASIIPPESTVLAKIGEAVRLARFAMVNKQCCIDNNMVALVPKLERVMPRFFNYALHTADIEFLMNPGTIPTLNIRALRAFDIPLPDLETQRRIADYLDKEISEMDAMIEEFEGLVGSLRYRKKRFVEFEFQKSERWNLVPQRLKLLVDSEDNRRVPIDSGDRKDIQGEYPYYGASGVIDYVNDYIWDNEKRLLVSEDGANLAMRNHPIAFVADGQYWVNNHAHVLKPRHNYPAELLAAAIEISPIHHLITGSAQPKLTAFNMGEIAFPFPKDTDSAISMNVFIQEELSRMDALIEESTRLIENLKARKTALITEVVTGRKEV